MRWVWVDPNGGKKIGNVRGEPIESDASNANGWKSVDEDILVKDVKGGIHVKEDENGASVNV